MAVFGRNRTTVASTSFQAQRPSGLNIVFGPNEAVNKQRVEQKRRQLAKKEYEEAVAEYNRQVAEFNKQLEEQKRFNETEQAKAEDFNRRVQTGDISFNEFLQTGFAQEIKQKYGSDIGGDVLQASYYEFLLQFPQNQRNDRKRKDLEYSRALSLRSAGEKLKLKDRSAIPRAERLAMAQASKERKNLIAEYNKLGYVVGERGRLIAKSGQALEMQRSAQIQRFIQSPLAGPTVVQAVRMENERARMEGIERARRFNEKLLRSGNIFLNQRNPLLGNK